MWVQAQVFKYAVRHGLHAYLSAFLLDGETATSSDLRLFSLRALRVFDCGHKYFALRRR